MGRRVAVGAFGAVLFWSTAVLAQGATEGPLQPPDPDAGHAATHPKSIKAKHKKARNQESGPLSDRAFDTGIPMSRASHVHDAPSAVSDPVSLGMKWQGNNSSALQTRASNYNGAAYGTGAEVGLKVHF